MSEGNIVKRKILEYLGWTMSYGGNDDWIKVIWITDKNIDYVRAGLPIEKAFGIAVKESGKTLNELLAEIKG
jgi:hypothetical protein